MCCTQPGQPKGDKGGNGHTLHKWATAGQFEAAVSLNSFWDDKADRVAISLVQVEILAGGGGGVTDTDLAKFLA